MISFELKNLPPEDAIHYFRQKGYQITWNWQEMLREAHARAFTVAKATKVDILEDIRKEIDRALAEGTTLEEFRKNLTPMLQRKGWWGVGVDPETGEIVQLGSPWRLNTIFNTNIQTAYQVGHYRQMTDPDVLRDRPFWRYVAMMDERTRPEHAAWHGTVLPADDPWWDEHFPPNGWNCRCTAVSLSDYEIERDGYEIGKKIEDRFYDWKNPDTGVVEKIPVGIDPGWNYNPGKHRGGHD